MIPVIDLFAGPGGLCEGFSQQINGRHPFRPVLSIEMNPTAHKTLQLRAFVHYFMRNELPIPTAYYEYVYGRIEKEVLFGQYKDAADEAQRVAWCAELGGSRITKTEFDDRIRAALNNTNDWLLIGGPPCQAYSLAGRSRSVGGIKNRDNLTREEAELEFNKDRRQRLYRQYLRILAVHSPSIFVMENVAGMLSARVDGEPVFPKILADLQEPGRVVRRYFPGSVSGNHTYRVFSFVTGVEESADEGEKFLIRAENYGVPQCRHRVILLGIRDDYLNKGVIVRRLKPVTQSLKVIEAIGDLPSLNSKLSRRGRGIAAEDKWSVWNSLLKDAMFERLDIKIQRIIKAAARGNQDVVRQIDPQKQAKNSILHNWYWDEHLTMALNHTSRSHMPSDLFRYLFVAAYGMAYGHSPVIADFPIELLPDHSNVNKNGKNGSCDFADRFKVQLWQKPSSTVTSHIAKDGHYFIHPDVAQCRSLSVREAARLQTFPDNYFFEGNRTEQYHQVGNAVPPYLANQLGEVVYDLFKQIGVK